MLMYPKVYRWQELACRQDRTDIIVDRILGFYRSPKAARLYQQPYRVKHRRSAIERLSYSYIVFDDVGKLLL